MEEITSKQKCSGCGACMNICPVGCISMKYDEEGFLYPYIDQSMCVDCGMCKKTCPVNNDYIANPKGVAYACINKDDKIRSLSSSGGVFTALAERVIEQNGTVFGAAFDDDFEVVHTYINDASQLFRQRGSKYVQSRIGSTYKEAKEFLDDGKLVLFSGTPCQIAGLKAYLGKNYENLITVDLICHGVPSPKVWKKYLRYQENMHSLKLLPKSIINFRDKCTGWYKFSLSIEFDEKVSYSKDLSQDLFMKAFLNNICLRPSCYNCHSKSICRQSDITLADFWGVKQQLPDMFDNKGTSLVLINSEVGRKLFEDIQKKLIVAETDYDVAIERNTAAYKSCKMPKQRLKFMTSLDTVDFKSNVESNLKISIIKKIKRIIKRGIKYVQK